MAAPFETFIKRSDEPAMFAFLQALSTKEKKALAPEIKRLMKFYYDWGDNGRIRASDKQREMLHLAAFVCYTRVEYARIPGWQWSFREEMLEKVFDWYCPPWFSDLLNDEAATGRIVFGVPYEWVMRLTRKGHLQPNGELLAGLLPRVILGGKDGIFHYSPENLLQWPETLQEHIWFLFQFASTLQAIDRAAYTGPANTTVEQVWTRFFKEFTATGQIDRFRVLRESLLASNRNFPKPISTALGGIKKIMADPGFNAEGFLDTVPLILANETRGVVVSCLGLLEKLGAKRPAYKERIPLLACQALVHTDADLQARAARLIERFGDAERVALRQELGVYSAGLLSGTRTTLAVFLDVIAPAVVPTGEVVEVTVLSDVPFPSGVDDLVFLASAAFDNNAPWHFDALPAALVTLVPKLQAEDVIRLEPAFQRAVKLLKNRFQFSLGALDHLLAVFFIDVGNYLMRRFPAVEARLAELYLDYDGRQGTLLGRPGQDSFVSGWKFDVPFYGPPRLFLLEVLDKIRKDDDLPVLSMPTHEPCWIDPGVLIDRLQRYQQAGVAPGEIDLQLALSRCYLANGRDHLEAVRRQLSGELVGLMRFLLDGEAGPVEPFVRKGAWMVASLSRTTRSPWPEFEEWSYYDIPFSNYIGEQEWTCAIGRKLFVIRQYSKSERSAVKKFFAKLLPLQEDPPMLYDFMNTQTNYIVEQPGDMRRILSMVPNNPTSLLAETINKCFQLPSFSSEGEKRMAGTAMQFLLETWQPPSQMALLLLGLCLIASDKTVASTAGSVWLQAVSREQIDNTRLGSIMGRLESIEFVPIKRFTDLVSQQLFNVSPRHNRELGILTGHMLLELPDEPVKNLKKLLELYVELAAGQVPVLVKEKLKVWGKTKGLEKVVGRIG